VAVVSLKVTELVEIFFDLSAVSNAFLTLSDATYGLLAPSGGTDYTLAGDIAVDVTAQCHSYSVSRGRSRELDQIVAGNATLRLKNYDGRFLPDAFYNLDLLEDGTGDAITEDGGASATITVDTPTTYGAGNIVPGKRVRITSATKVIFDGTIETWNLDYAADRSVTTTVAATDSLAQLARKTLTLHTPTDTAPGARITTMLGRDEIGWPGGNPDVGTGVSVLGTTIPVTEGTNALQYAQLIAKSDIGRIFASRNNILTYRDRNNLVQASSSATFSDDGAAINFQRASLAYSSELLYTDVNVGGTLVQGGTVNVGTSSATARTAYGIRALDYTGLLIGTTAAQADSQATLIAGTLLGYYSTPMARVEMLDVSLDALGASNQSVVTGLELGDKVTVKWTPRGGLEAINSDFIVEGIAHQADTGGHDAKLSLSPVLAF